jgi:hypothetical protein
MAMVNRFGAWANLTDMDNVKFELVNGNVEFHVGELELVMSVATLDAWITAAQAAQHEITQQGKATPRLARQPAIPKLPSK